MARQYQEGALGLLKSALDGYQTASLVKAAKSDPDLDPIRRDPRFQAMMAAAEARVAAAKTNLSSG